MATTLTWILGAIAGTVLWSGLLRLPGHLARWLCAPYGIPGPAAMMVSMLASVAFLLLLVVGVLLGLELIIHRAPSTEEAKQTREILFISSILGYAAIPVVIRLEAMITGRRKS